MCVKLIPTRSLFLAAILALPTAGMGWAGESKIDVRVDPRVELMSIIFRLAGHPEYNTAPGYPYLADVEAHFRKFENHAVVQAARDLRRRHGVSYDAVASMALHLTEAYELKERIPLDRPPRRRCDTGPRRPLRPDQRGPRHHPAQPRQRHCSAGCD